MSLREVLSMNRYAEAIAIVEGATEEKFINSILAPYLGYRNIGMHATQVSKPGQKGGDVNTLNRERIP